MRKPSIEFPQVPPVSSEHRYEHSWKADAWSGPSPSACSQRRDEGMALNELEEKCIERFRGGGGAPDRGPDDTTWWIELGFHVLLDGGALLRASRYKKTTGGDVVNLEGEPIDAVGHQSPFVAAIDAASRQVVLDIASDVMGLSA